MSSQKSSLVMMKIDNPEKKTHTPARENDLLPEFPARIAICGRPGSGKGCQCMNLLAREDPPFDTYTVCHWEKNPLEWDSVLEDQEEYRVLGWREEGFPDIDSFDPNKKNALILDELPYDTMSVAQKSHLERIFNFAASHKSVTCFILVQDLFSIPISVRRSLDFIAIASSPIKSTEGLFSRMLKIDVGALFKKFCKTKWDFLVFDFTGGPTVRLNWYQPIEGVPIK